MGEMQKSNKKNKYNRKYMTHFDKIGHQKNMQNLLDSLDRADNKNAEQFFRDKAFPVGITDEEWKKWKHTHKGINWHGFAIETMKEYAEELSKGFARWLPSVGVEIRDGIYYTDLSKFDLDAEQDLFTQLFSLYQQSLK